MRWEVEYTDEFGRWFRGLPAETQERVIGTVRRIERSGPTTGRPTVDSIVGSRHSNMKEIRVGTLRILFAFDPRRVAILLLGGDKHGSWSDWYKRAIPLADRIYDRHLDDLRKERLS